MFDETEYCDRCFPLWRLILIDLCLGVIALASCFNGVIAFSLIVTFAATTIKIYKLDPEPFFFLSLQAVVSCLMLHDAPTTIATIIAVFVTCMTTGSMNFSFERMVPFLASLAITTLLGKVAATVCSTFLVVAFIAIKLRPLKPVVNCVLVLLLLATSVPVNGHVTAALSAIGIVLVTLWYGLLRLKGNAEQFYPEQAGANHNDNSSSSSNNNNNNYYEINNSSRLNLMNGGQLKLCNTTDSLDLHGYTVTSALKTLHQFLKEHENAFRVNPREHTRYLKVITGEDGKNHVEDNMNLVKPTVANFLKINKYRYQVNPDRPGVLKIDLESHVK